jgi:hypothetical protein
MPQMSNSSEADAPNENNISCEMIFVSTNEQITDSNNKSKQENITKHYHLLQQTPTTISTNSNSQTSSSRLQRPTSPTNRHKLKIDNNHSTEIHSIYKEIVVK